MHAHLMHCWEEALPFTFVYEERQVLEEDVIEMYNMSLWLGHCEDTGSHQTMPEPLS